MTFALCVYLGELIYLFVCSKTGKLIYLFLFLFQISSLRFIFLINQELINVIRTESQKLVPT